MHVLKFLLETQSSVLNCTCQHVGSKRFVWDACNHILSDYMVSYSEYCNTGQQRFCPMTKNVRFSCIFGQWIKICFQNFSFTHTFRSRLKGWNLLRQDTKVCFYHGGHEEFKDFFAQEDGVCFAMTFVPLWKFLPKNITHIGGACSLICQKWAWRWFYSTMEIDSPPFLWLMQPTWRKDIEPIG
jgi:hypothetical protein